MALALAFRSAKTHPRYPIHSDIRPIYACVYRRVDVAYQCAAKAGGKEKIMSATSTMPLHGCVSASHCVAPQDIQAQFNLLNPTLLALVFIRSREYPLDGVAEDDASDGVEPLQHPHEDPPVLRQQQDFLRQVQAEWKRRIRAGCTRWCHGACVRDRRRGRTTTHSLTAVVAVERAALRIVGM